ncbi:MAG: enoyl-CoA hydratase [Deltaproteobacteria bacterium]|nr:MAG: enoyl-CoA hydratase [Deltaproteobacteria bacterium]
MAVVEWEKDGSVAVIKLNNGENRQNPDFAKGLLTSLDAILEDKDIYATIITSTDPKNWSQGIDLEFLMGCFNAGDMQTIKDFMFSMNEVFKKLLLFPMPVIAAINGHAFGNGAILSCACDFRMMRSDRGYFCFPEVDLGIPFLPGMIAFVKKAIPYYRFNELKLTGRRATAVELEADHVIEKASENPEKLMEDALAFARTFQKKRGIFGEHKKRLHKQIVEVIDTEDKPFIDSLFLFVQE